MGLSITFGIIERHGGHITVNSVYDGLQALKAYEKSKEADNPYDLIIVDLSIPGGMGGLEAIEGVRKRHPEARVIVSSGYADDPVMAHYKDYGFNGKIQKPMELADLAATLKNAMDEPGGQPNQGT